MKRLLFCLLFFFGMSSASLASLKTVSLQLQWLHQFQFAGFYMAKEKGFYKQKGLKVNIKELSQNYNTLQDVLDGKSDFGLGRSSLLIEKTNGKPIVALAAILQSSPLIIITTNPNIKRVQDLKNKKIMMTDSVITSAPLFSMLLSQGVDIEKVQKINHTFLLNDLINKKTDAMSSYISNEPFILKNKKIPFTTFNPKDYGFNFYDEILFTSKRLLKQDPKLVKDFRDASLEGWEYAFKHIEESAKFIYQNYNSQKKSLENLIYEGKVLKKLAYEETSNLGNIDPKKLNEITKIYQISQLQNKKLDTKDFLDPYNTLKQNVNIGILAKLGKTLSIEKWYSLSSYLKEALPMYNFQVTPLSFDEIEEAIIYKKIDFLLTNPMNYIQLEYKYGLTSIASLKNESTDIPRGVSKFGAVIFTKKDNKHINTLNDLRKYSFGAVSEKSLGGWLMAQKELKDNGVSCDNLHVKFFKKHDKVVKAVLSEEISAGTVRTNTLEKMAYNNVIDLQDFKIINQKKLHSFPYLLSTTLYPQWPFAKLSHTPEKLANRVLSSLLKQSFAYTTNKDNAYSWTIPQDYSKVHQLLKELKIYPYDLTNFTIEEVIDKYKPWLTSIVVILFLIILTLFYIQYTNINLEKEVKRRTKELTFANKKLQKLASIDELTGISNRREFLANLEKSIHYSQRYNAPLAFLSIDVDLFKNVNDTYGHDVGDKVLIHIVNTIKGAIRNSDYFGRMGGEEFAIALNNTTFQNALVASQKIRTSVENNSYKLDNKEIKLTISIGLSMLEFNDNIETIIKNADIALYQAKEKGRNQVQIDERLSTKTTNILRNSI